MDTTNHRIKLRKRERIQAAHDMLSQLLSDEVRPPEGFTDVDALQVEAALTTLCWVLMHKGSFNYNLKNVEKHLKECGYVYFPGKGLIKNVVPGSERVQ